MKSQTPHRKWRPHRRKRTRQEIVELVILVDRLLDRGQTMAEACDSAGISRPALRRIELALGLQTPRQTKVKLEEKEENGVGNEWHFRLLRKELRRSRSVVHCGTG